MSTYYPVASECLTDPSRAVRACFYVDSTTSLGLLTYENYEVEKASLVRAGGELSRSMEVSTNIRWAPTGSAVATARPIDTAVWEGNRSEITDLYIVQNKTLNEVKEYMSSKHGFNPR